MQASSACRQINSGFELEEAVFSTAPVGLHCVDSRGVILWANQTELNLLGLAREQYVGKLVESFVHTDTVEAHPNAYLNGHHHEEHHTAVDDKIIYRDVLKKITSGEAIHNVPIRFVTSSGTVAHIIMDCDGHGILQPNAISLEERYYRCFTRDDTARKVQNMRSVVLFEETNRSLQMLDNFMNRSMSQMRMPLALMERACGLVTESIEDIDEAITGNSFSGNSSSSGTVPSIPPSAASASQVASRSFSRTLQQLGTVNNFEQNSRQTLNVSPPLSAVLSATSEARSVARLASRIVDDALSLVDDISDLCRFDQGQSAVIEKEAVKLREISLEALARVHIPGIGGAVEVMLNIQEGAPSRVMTDSSVLQRCLALLMNFAVDAAANAASKSPPQDQAIGSVILSISGTEPCPTQRLTSSCKISIAYSNPPNGGCINSISENVDITHDSTSFFHQRDGVTHCLRRGHCGSKSAASSDTERGGLGSMTHRIRFRESLECEMTAYRRGSRQQTNLSLAHHLVSAQGSDLRYEVESDPCSLPHDSQKNWASLHSTFWFILPISLDFPDRLNAENISKHDLQPHPQNLSGSRASKRQKRHDSPMIFFNSSHHPTSLGPAALNSMYIEDLRSASLCRTTPPEQNNVTISTTQKMELSKRYPGVAPGARPLILIVEDTDVSASLIAMHLRKLWCKSQRAENGEVALELLRSAPAPNMYSLILMDLRMPVMDGFEAAKIIKGSSASNIPIVALTGETSEGNKTECDEIGFDDYQTKPLKRLQLRDLLIRFVPGYEAPP